MRLSVQAGDADELLVLLNDSSHAGNLHVIEDQGLSVTSVSSNSLAILGPPAVTTKYAVQDILNAKVEEGTQDVVVEMVNHKRGELERLRGKIEPFQLEHARRWTARLLKLAYEDSIPAKRIKLIINPLSGVGKSRSIWNEKLKPLFEAAGTKVDVVFTERIGHATEIAKQLDLNAYDSLVCMSGDGLIYEVINGFASRPDALRALRMPLGIIPAGSGNGLATSLLGPEESLVLTRTALVVIKGRPMPLDVMSVTQGDKRFYSFLSQAFGLMADLDVGTDHLRWMGPSRFVMEYLNGAMTQRKYACELSMRVVEDDKSNIIASCRRADDARLDKIDVDQPFAPDADLSMPALRFGTVNDPLDHTKDPGSWITSTEPVSSIYAGSLPYMAPNLLQFPAARADGLVDLTIQPVVGRIAMLSAVDGSEKGKHIHRDFVKYYKVEAYRLTPKGVVGEPKRAKWLAIDGEVMPYTPFQVEAHKGLARVLTLRKDWYLPEEWTRG